MIQQIRFWPIVLTSSFFCLVATGAHAVDAVMEYPSTRYTISDNPVFVPSCSASDANGYVYVGGSSLMRFIGTGWQKITPRMTEHLAVSSQNMVYGIGAEIFRFHSNGEARPEIIELTELIRRELPNPDTVRLYRDASVVGDEVFLSQTWHITRLSVDDQGHDQIAVVDKRKVLPPHLKFRRVFGVNGRPMVQLEDVRTASKTYLGWLKDDNSVDIIPDLVIHDHVIDLRQIPLPPDAAESEPFRLFAFGVREMLEICGSSVRRMTPPLLKMKETMKLQAFPIDANRFVCSGESLGIVMFDREANVLFHHPCPPEQRHRNKHVFNDSQGHLWLCYPGVITRIDIEGRQSWTVPNRMPVHALAIKDDRIAVVTDAGAYVANIERLSNGFTALTSFEPITGVPQSTYPTATHASGQFWIGTTRGLFVLPEQGPYQAVKVPIADATSSAGDMVLMESSQTMYVFPHRHGHSNVVSRLKLTPHATASDESAQPSSPQPSPLPAGDASTLPWDIQLEREIQVNPDQLFQPQLLRVIDPVPDANGMIWFASFRDDRKWDLYSLDTRQEDRVTSYPLDARPFLHQGALMFAVHGGDCARFDPVGQRFLVDDRFESTRRSLAIDPFDGRYPLRTITTQSGAALIANPSMPLYRLQSHSGRPQLQPLLQVVESSGASCAVEDQCGQVWISIGNKLTTYRADALQHRVPARGRVLLGRVAITDSEYMSETPPTSDKPESPTHQRASASSRSSGSGRSPTSGRITSRELPLSRDTPWADEVVLDYTPGTLRIEFSAPQAFEPNLTQFTTRMVNLNDRWSVPSYEAFRQFPALREGEYRFEVKAVFPDNSESELSTLSVVVIPPWHRTRWFYSLVGLGIVATGCSFWAWQTRWQRFQLHLLRREVQVRQNAEVKLKEHHDEVLRNERLRAVEELVAAVAHDVNNCLCPVSVYSEMLQNPEVTGDQSKVRSFGEIIAGCVNDASEIIGNLHHWSHSNDVEMVELLKVAEEVVGLAKARLAQQPEKEIVITISNESCLLQCSQSSIRRVLLNLVHNAIDAIESQGEIAIRYRQSTSETVIEVADTGIGMNELTRKSCLDPFFSTKGKHGCGLGLANVRSIVEGYSGHVEIDSQLGQGSTFRLVFPADPNDETVANEGAKTIRSQPLSYRILVLDDFDATATALQMMLQSQGHTAFCSDSFTVLDDLETLEIDILLTDYRMPGKNGYELCTEVADRYPHIFRIIMSGYEEPGIREVCDAFIQKPVSSSKLATAIRESGIVGN